MLVDFKRVTGSNLTEIAAMDPSTLEPEVLAGLIWLAMRMSGQPDATYDDALDIPFTSLDLGETPEDPS